MHILRMKADLGKLYFSSPASKIVKWGFLFIIEIHIHDEWTENNVGNQKAARDGTIEKNEKVGMDSTFLKDKICTPKMAMR